MDIKNLNTFIHVAELGSFSKAGHLLGYSQPTVSVQIRQLEDELGVQLFDRIGHTIELTAAGQEMLLYAQQICDLSQQMHHSSAPDNQPTGLLRLALADSLCASMITQHFAAFQKEYPGVRLEITTGGTPELFAMLDHNEVDIVCTLDAHIYNTAYVIAHEVAVDVHFVAAASNPLSNIKTISLYTLAQQPFLLTEKNMSYRRLMDERLAQSNIQLQPALTLGRTDLLCQLVAQDAGISFLPDHVTQSFVGAGQLVRLSVEDVHIQVWEQVLYRKDKWINAPMDAMLRHFANNV